MALLNIVIGPHPLFRKKAAPFEAIDDNARAFADDLLETMYENRGVGIAATMVGQPMQLIAIDIQPEGIREPLVCFNPTITWSSDTESVNEEASLSFPGISAEIKRPDSITFSYLDREGTEQTLTADGWQAIVIQHEMDYLAGRTFLDHLSKIKRDRLIKKMQKSVKSGGSCCADPHCSNNH